jgi:hypothetical protein
MFHGSELQEFASIFVPWYRTEFRAFLSSAEWFGTEFREFASIFVPLYRIPRIYLFQGMVWNSESFPFHGTARIPPEQTNVSVKAVFRGIIFMSEIANPM